MTDISPPELACPGAPRSRTVDAIAGIFVIRSRTVDAIAGLFVIRSQAETCRTSIAGAQKLNRSSIEGSNLYQRLGMLDKDPLSNGRDRP